jgi:plasmid stability protein
MTVTVKLDPKLEERLRQRAAATGRTSSALIREALEAFLGRPEEAQRKSAFELGRDLFGHPGGAPDLAESRKQVLADVLEAKHKARAR